jgi:hypothetical protein
MMLFRAVLGKVGALGVAAGLAVGASAASDERTGTAPQRPAWLEGEVAGYRRAAHPKVSARVLRVRDVALRALRDAPRGTNPASSIHRVTIAEFGEQRPNLMFLDIQTKVQNMSQLVQALSNIMRADHDAKLNAIRNIRS